jgi:PTH2 family peptidyl-tRNA hydrolase
VDFFIIVWIPVMTPSSTPSERTHKQAIIIAKYLNMRKGKMIAQGAHASWGAVLSRAQRVGDHWLIPHDEDIGPWLEGRFAKIALSVDSEHELLALYHQAQSLGLPCALIRDAGLTEFHGVPTLTAIAIGPAEHHKIDPITSHLKLL